MSNVKRGFTLPELLVIVAILIILTALTVPFFRYFGEELDLNNSAEGIINSLRLAQNKTLASEGFSQWGVYFTTTTVPHQYILFKGPSFALRDALFDEYQNLPNSVEISEIQLDGTNEVVFNRINGTANQSGSITLRLKNDFSKTKTIFIESSGQVGLSGPSVPINSRLKDSRHVHFDYSRLIATTTETITLTFESTVIENIVIAENLKDGQIYWEGGVNVGGEIQKIKIHTHRLNNPDTQFSIHRDRRYNNKSLVVTISGDGSGTVIDYSADGLNTTSNSVFVSNLQWQ